MQPQDINLDSYFGELSDVGYDGGLSDSALAFTGSSTLQEVTLGSSTLGLDSQYGDDNSTSVYDFIEAENSVHALGLSGVSDPPFQSASYSTPTPHVSPPSPSAWAGLTSLSKLGSSFAALFGNHTKTLQPAYIPGNNVVLPGGVAPTPHTAVSGQTVLILLIVGAAVILLLSAED